MGQHFDKDTFTASDHRQFRERLQQQIIQLKDVIRQASFSRGSASIGAELEMYMIDQHGLPAPIIEQIIETMGDKQVTEEINQYNVEYNLSPVPAKGAPFSAMTNELLPAIDALTACAKKFDARPVSIGILPTLTKIHLHKHYLTDRARFRALVNHIVTPDGEPFAVDINGQDSLKMAFDEVTLEGANTSFQVHLKIPADRFKQFYNAAQLITPLVLAVAGNSPLFMGKRLWQETRIALFKQATDIRAQPHNRWQQPARVPFGQGWVRDDAWELFAQNVALYRPLLPYLFDDNQPFAELLLHHGTVWSWNRPVFDPVDGGHLRIEYRAFPAGPTVIDMMANAALAIGWTQALVNDIDDMLVKLPFHYAEYNFCRAAQHGLQAKILWPQKAQHQLQEVAITDVIKSMLPKAAEGLAQLGVDSTEINKMMTVIEDRVANQQTGSRWQLSTLDKYQRKHQKDQALALMLSEYMDNAAQGHPVSHW